MAKSMWFYLGYCVLNIVELKTAENWKNNIQKPD